MFELVKRDPNPARSANRYVGESVDKTAQENYGYTAPKGININNRASEQRDI